MPPIINSQNLFPNAQFQQFVDFAEAAVSSGKQKAIARIDAGELGGIVNRTIRPGSGDWVGIGAGRLASLKRANNTTRDAFMKAVADMFGGVDHIPDSVKEAMKLDDYGKGKPLTARRILAALHEAQITFSVPDDNVLSVIQLLYLSILNIDQFGGGYFPALRTLVESACDRLVS